VRLEAAPKRSAGSGPGGQRLPYSGDRLRGRGRSHAGLRSAPDGERFEVLAGVRYLQEAGVTRVSVAGASLRGGRGALAATPIAARAPPSAHPLHRERGDTTAAGIPRLVAIHQQHERMPASKELLVVDGSAQTLFLFQTDQAGAGSRSYPTLPAVGLTLAAWAARRQGRHHCVPRPRLIPRQGQSDLRCGWRPPSVRYTIELY
jgi:hypothetical protein